MFPRRRVIKDEVFYNSDGEYEEMDEEEYDPEEYICVEWYCEPGCVICDDVPLSQYDDEWSSVRQRVTRDVPAEDVPSVCGSDNEEGTSELDGSEMYFSDEDDRPRYEQVVNYFGSLNLTNESVSQRSEQRLARDDAHTAANENPLNERDDEQVRERQHATNADPVVTGVSVAEQVELSPRLQRRAAYLQQLITTTLQRSQTE